VIAAGTSWFFLPFLRMCQNFFAQKVGAVINYLLKTFEVKTHPVYNYCKLKMTAQTSTSQLK
jgi:hypothetical protein